MSVLKLTEPYSKIMVVGDIHGHFDCLDHLIEKNNPDLVFQVGDFGYWPKFQGVDLLSCGKPWYMKINNKNIPIYFCDGNHEDHDQLKNISEITEILPNTYYTPRGSIITLYDETNILFMGGAESIDYKVRTLGFDWFPDESISQRDLYKVPDIKIDVVISHSAPMDFDIWFAREREPSRMALSTILHDYKPKEWYFGHYHEYMTGYYKETDTKWKCLNMLPEKNCFIWFNNDKQSI